MTGRLNVWFGNRFGYGMVRQGRPSRRGRGRRAGFSRAALLILLTCILNGLAVERCLADRQSDWQDCRSQDLDVNIPACTRLIEDPASSGVDQREALTLRGFAYLSQHAFVSAGRDFSSVLKLEPGNVKALVGRSLAQFGRGQNEDAILDYGLARRLNSAAVDALMRSNEALKEIATAAEQKPPPAAKLDDLQKALIKCQPGTRQEGLSCVAIICPSGQRLDGNSCVPVVCGTGYRVSGSTCVAIVCPTGQRLAGNDCVQIVCGPDANLVGNDCVPNKRYAALAVGKNGRLAYGAAWNGSTPTQVENDAVSRCLKQLPGANCKLAVAGDGCVALAWTRAPATGWGAAARATKDEAISAANATCNRLNPRLTCITAGAYCSTQ